MMTLQSFSKDFSSRPSHQVSGNVLMFYFNLLLFQESLIWTQCPQSLVWSARVSWAVLDLSTELWLMLMAGTRPWSGCTSHLTREWSRSRSLRSLFSRTTPPTGATSSFEIITRMRFKNYYWKYKIDNIIELTLIKMRSFLWNKNKYEISRNIRLIIIIED